MQKILVVDDSLFGSRLLAARIAESLQCETVVAHTRAEAVELIAGSGKFHAAVVDLHLPDAPLGEAVDDTLSADIPTVILTGDFEEHTRAKFLNRPVVDYFLKDPSAVDKVLNTLACLETNPSTSILLVDDSRIIRHLLSATLKPQKYTLHEASDGKEALEIMGRHPEIALVITDWEMPGLSGFELVKALRNEKTSAELAIIGISSLDTPIPVSVKMLNVGADDFLVKPFHPEELLCRVRHNLAMLKYIAMVREASITDHLTGLRNRLHLDKRGREIFSQAAHTGKSLVAVVADIDHFKKVNDNCGHASGDAVLTRVASRMKTLLQSAAVVARFGGEEFCALYSGTDQGRVEEELENLRREIETEAVASSGFTIRVTISIGAASGAGGSDFETLLKKADECLYRAKTEGRNRLVFDKIRE